MEPIFRRQGRKGNVVDVGKEKRDAEENGFGGAGVGLPEQEVKKEREEVAVEVAVEHLDQVHQGKVDKVGLRPNLPQEGEPVPEVLGHRRSVLRGVRAIVVIKSRGGHNITSLNTPLQAKSAHQKAGQGKKGKHSHETPKGPGPLRAPKVIREEDRETPEHAERRIILVQL